MGSISLPTPSAGASGLVCAPGSRVILAHPGQLRGCAAGGLCLSCSPTPSLSRTDQVQGSTSCLLPSGGGRVQCDSSALRARALGMGVPWEWAPARMVGGRGSLRQGCLALPMAPVSFPSYSSRRKLRSEGSAQLLSCTPGVIGGLGPEAALPSPAGG